MLLPGHGEARPRDEIAKRHWSGQCLRLPHQMGADLLLQELHSHLVVDQVMHHLLHHPATACRVLRYEMSQERSLAHIQTIRPRIEFRAQLPDHISAGGIHLDLFDHKPRPAIDHLHGLGKVFPQHRGPQDVVAIDHRLHRP